MFILDVAPTTALAPNGWTVLLAVVGIVPGIIAAILAYLANATGQRNGEAIHNVHLSVNGRFDELLRINSELAHAKGLAEGRVTSVVLAIPPTIPPIIPPTIPPTT